jgi:hypothetical protein
VAYSLTQKRLIARELARSGGNIAAAVRALHAETESLRGIGERTVRRYLNQKTFQRLLAEQRDILDRAAAQAAEETERRRMLTEMRGSILERQQLDEQIADELRNTILADLQDEEHPLPTRERVRLYKDLTRIIDARRDKAMPAVAGFGEGQRLIQALQEVLAEQFGDRAATVVRAIRGRYAALQQAQQEAQGEAR